MKKRIFASCLAMCILLSGCTLFGKEYTFRDFLGDIPFADEINDAVIGESEQSDNIKRPEDVKFPEEIKNTDNSDEEYINTEDIEITDDTENAQDIENWILGYDDIDQDEIDQAYVENKFRNSFREYKDGEFSYKEYIYDYNTMGSTMLFISATNNSKRSVTITADCTAKNKDGSVIGTGEKTLKFIGPGETSCMCVDFYGVEGVDSVESSFTYEEEKEYKPVLKDLEIIRHENKNSVNGNNLVVEIKNNGSEYASIVDAFALFFTKDGYLINYEHEFGCNVIPNQTQYIQFNNYTDFFDGKYDHAEVYFTGYTFSPDPSYYTIPTVSNDKFEIKQMEYTFNNFGALLTSNFFLIKNNSDKTVNANGTGILRNKDGTIAAVSGLISDNIIAPGETALCSMGFVNKPKDSFFDYSLSFEIADDMYVGIQKDLSLKTVKTDEDTLDITVTNNGSIPAEFVEGRVLFFDKAGNIVFDTSVSFFGGNSIDDTSIRPGGSFTATASSRLDFDHAEVYVSGFGYNTAVR